MQRRKFRKSSRRLGNPVKRHFNDRAGKVVYFHLTCAIVHAGMFLQTDKTVFSDQDLIWNIVEAFKINKKGQFLQKKRKERAFKN